MRYTITRAVSSAPGEIEITAEEFLATKVARRDLLVLVSMEEKLDVLMENYIEYEESLLSVTLRQAVRSHLRYGDIMSERRIIARRLANLLAAARAYIDQIRQDVGAICGKESAALKEFEAALSEEWDGRLGYRVMEALRNHVLHSSIFVGGLSFPSDWDWDAKNPDDPNARLRFRIVPGIDVSGLESNPKFKPSVLDELKGFAKSNKRRAQVSVTPFVRQYIESLGRTHERIRKVLVEDLARCEGQLDSVEARARSAFEGSMSGLAVISAASSESEEEKGELIYLPREVRSYRKDLEERNRGFVRLSQRYVSGDDRSVAGLT